MIQMRPRARAAPLIEHVLAGSLADLAGIQAGHRLLAINGHAIHDQIDYHFYGAESTIEVTTVGADGEEQRFTITKHPDADLGLEIAETELDDIRICTNKCFFCFLKGLPKGLRKTLYTKDDDYRLSFLHGNFVTLTNLTEEDWQRLEEQKLSPLHVSVHATDPEVRLRLLGIRQGPDVLDQLRRLSAIGIRYHTQIVMCPGVNDGPQLDRSIEDLAALYPDTMTIAVVPVGATMYHERRMGPLDGQGMSSCTPRQARDTIAQVRRYQQRFRRELGTALVFPSDELYITAGVRPPAATAYEGYPQYENGIGMVRVLLDDAALARRRIRSGSYRDPVLRHVTIACGRLIAPTLAALASEAGEMLGVRIDVVAVASSLFGERVNVSGLLAGGDYAAGLRSLGLGEAVFLPRPSLDYYGRHFLDDATPEALAGEIGRPLVFAATLTEVLESIISPPLQTITGAGRAAVTNGRSWV